MKPVEQTIYSVGNGNCFAAAVASVLERPLETVPHFCGEEADDKTWYAEFCLWAEKEGLAVVSTYWEDDLSLLVHNAYCILCGLNQRGQPHAVVGKSIHTGVQELEDGKQRFCFELVQIWDPNQISREQWLTAIQMVIFLFPGANGHG